MPITSRGIAGALVVAAVLGAAGKCVFDPLATPSSKNLKSSSNSPEQPNPIDTPSLNDLVAPRIVSADAQPREIVSSDSSGASDPEAASASAQIEPDASNQTGWSEEVLADGSTCRGMKRDGVKVGVWQQVNPDGSVAVTGQYDENGRPIGTWNAMFDGRITVSATYMEDGSLRSEVFDDVTGNLKTRMTQKPSPDEPGKVVLEGPYVSYWPSGVPQEECSYLDGKKEGISRTYYSTGELKSEAVWSKGELVGEPQYFEAEGSGESEN